MRPLFLRKGADRRLRAGHLWVYSNEVDTKRSPLTSFEPAEAVALTDAGGTVIGSAYLSPNALICARLYAPCEERPLDEAFFVERLRTALAVRQAAFPGPFYRLVYGDSDGLPGIVIDRYGEYLVLQLNQPGLEQHQAPLLAALTSVVQPSGVLLRRDSRALREQDLQAPAEVILGEVPEQVTLEENGVAFSVPVFSGQKTGWFYDHRMSRARLAAWVADKRVLDVYSYIGGWGVQAAAFGAREVCCVDSSAQALEGVAANAALNGLSERVHTQRGAAAEVMAAMAQAGEQFDVVVLDPPAFIARKKDQKKGIAAYRRINELGLRLLAPGGLLVSASCSMHLGRSDLIGAINQAAVRAHATLRIVEQGAQGPDHPIHPAIAETEYLKAVFALRV